MAKTIEEWIAEDIEPFSNKSVSWLSANHFFRDPIRAVYVDSNFFFSPADGMIIYQREVEPDEAIVEVKGRAYTLRDAMFNPEFNKRCLVIGIFMTFYDPHINRVPYNGRLRFEHLESIATYNSPMLEIEKTLMNKMRIKENGDFLFHNERVLNSIFSHDLGQDYYILQIADFDVDCICHFDPEQNRAVMQGDRFGMIRYGSQVDLIIPIDESYKLGTVQADYTHVEAGVDSLVCIK